MSDQVGGGATDAAAVGLALTFPEGLRGQLAAMAKAWAPVDEAVAAGSAGLVKLGLVTADLNGSAAVARPIGVGRVRRSAGDVTVSGDAQTGRSVEAEARSGLADSAESTAFEFGAGGLWEAEVGSSERGMIRDEAGVVAVAPIAERGDADADSLNERVYQHEGGSVVVTLDGRPASAAPVGAGASFLRAGVAGGAADSRGFESREAIAPVAAFGTVASRRETVTAAGFGSSGAPGKAGTMERGVAPMAGALTGLRADVGAALKERAALWAPAEPELGGGGSVAFSRGETRGSRGMAMSAGSGEPPVGAGSEEAWAPQPAGRGTGGSGGDGMGIVQLDGRLVGHWLSEGMAREAGRPGAGTTSFDARQGPAWTPSGAL